MKKIIVLTIISLIFLATPVFASIQPEKEQNSLNDIEVEFKGGLGLTIIVKNIGENDIHLSMLELGFSGSLLVFLGKFDGFGEFELEPNNEKTFFIPIVGFGPGSIEATFMELVENGDTYVESTEVFIFGPFVRIIN
jgi:hypothetical protein